MRKLIVLLALLLAASVAMAEEGPKLAFSGDSGASFARADFGNWTFDVDQNIKFGFGPVSLKLNAGYTLDVVAPSNVFSWGYSLAYDQTFGKVNVYASVGSDSMNFTVGTGYAGHLFDDVKVGAKVSY